MGTEARGLAGRAENGWFDEQHRDCSRIWLLEFMQANKWNCNHSYLFTRNYCWLEGAIKTTSSSSNQVLAERNKSCCRSTHQACKDFFFENLTFLDKPPNFLVPAIVFNLKHISDSRDLPCEKQFHFAQDAATIRETFVSSDDASSLNAATTSRYSLFASLYVIIKLTRFNMEQFNGTWSDPWILPVK